MKKILVSALLLAGIASSALAQQDNHWYGAIDIGTLNMRNTDYADPGSLTVSGGFRFSRNLGVEGGLTAIGDSTLIDGTGTRTARQGDLRFLAVGFVPLNPTIELFGKAGLGLHSVRILGTGGYSNSPSVQTTANVIVGGGVQLNFNQRFGMRVQYEHLGKAKASLADPGADISRVTIGGVMYF